MCGFEKGLLGYRGLSFDVRKRENGQSWVTFRGLPSNQRSFMKGSWAFETDHGGQGEKHEKGICGAGLGTFHVVAQLPWEGGRCCGMVMTANAKVRGLEYHSFRLSAKFPKLTNQAEKGQVTCPRATWLVSESLVQPPGQ